MTARDDYDQDSAGGALDEAFVQAPDWRLPVDDVHAILRAHGKVRPDVSMRGYHEGGWYDEVDGHYVATPKLKALVAKRYGAARKAERA